MRKLALFGAGTLILIFAAAAVLQRASTAQPVPAAPDSLNAWVLAPGDSGRLKGPKQPVFFRHDIHAGANKIPCQYCHYSVDISNEPGVPSMQSCMGCHLIVGGSDSSHKVEIKKLRDAYSKNEPIPWVRVHTLARHAHFPHMRHVKALGPDACQTCHGDVARMPQVFKANNINNMGFCVTCHLQRKINRDCSVCHY
jgi:hypothetical protein